MKTHNTMYVSNLGTVASNGIEQIVNIAASMLLGSVGLSSASAAADFLPERT